MVWGACCQPGYDQSYDQQGWYVSGDGYQQQGWYGEQDCYAADPSMGYYGGQQARAATPRASPHAGPAQGIPLSALARGCFESAGIEAFQQCTFPVALWLRAEGLHAR